MKRANLFIFYLMFSIEKFNELVSNNNFNYNIIYKHQTNSTNNDALSIIKTNHYKEGMVFISDKQNKSRGRYNRLWHTDPDSHLAFSLILCPKIIKKKSGLISLMAGVSIIEGIKEISDINLKLKCI